MEREDLTRQDGENQRLIDELANKLSDDVKKQAVPCWTEEFSASGVKTCGPA